LIKIDDMTKSTGEGLGKDIMWEGGQLRHCSKEKYVEQVCVASAALSEVVKKYPWFVTLLKRACLGKLALNSSVSTKLECIDEYEAEIIGNNLMPCLKSRKITRAGIDLWRLQNRAIGELFQEFPWTKNMFNAIAGGVTKTAPWGMMFRLVVGTATSTIDLFTDIFVTYMFWSTGKRAYFVASLSSLVFSVVLSLNIVYVQNRGSSTQVILKECIPVLLGLKPTLDAYRVASGETIRTGATMDTYLELSAVKACELFTESIPGAIIQTMALLTTDDISRASCMSLAASALSTGFISATISYDFDTDPMHRERSPEFYGFVPQNATRRSIVFGTIVLFSATTLIIRCLAIVLFGLIGIGWAFMFLILDLSLFLFVKIARDDFWYWVPLGGKAEIFSSLSVRIVGKVVCDFTSIVQLRHPNEVGGASWTFGTLLTLASLPLAISVYIMQGGEANVQSKAIFCAKVLIPSSLSMLLLFFVIINRKYLNTFISTETARAMTIRHFRTFEDEFKADAVLLKSFKIWCPIEKEVKAWVEVNWNRWEEKRPKWLTDAVKEKIPLKYIPNPKKRVKEGIRRASLKENGGQIPKRRETKLIQPESHKAGYEYEYNDLSNSQMSLNSSEGV
jgi:hypothetical protein